MLENPIDTPAPAPTPDTSAPAALVETYRQEQAAKRLAHQRPETPASYEERQFIVSDFVDAIRQIPPHIPLRFHGGHIYELADVLQSGQLSSAADRIGAAASFDSKGEISVTRPETITTTIGNLEWALQRKNQGLPVQRTGYIDILDDSLPPGFVAVMVPATAEEASKGENHGNWMDNTDLHGPKLLRLLMPQEFLDRGQELLAQHGYPPEIGTSYRAFVAQIPAVIDQARQRFPYLETYQPKTPAPGISISL